MGGVVTKDKGIPIIAQGGTMALFEYCGIGEHTGRPQILVVTGDHIGCGPFREARVIVRDIERQHNALKALQKPHVRIMGKPTKQKLVTTDPLLAGEGIIDLVSLLKEQRYYVTISTRLPRFEERLLSSIDFWTVILDVTCEPHLALLDTHWWFYYNSPHFSQTPDPSTRSLRLNDMARRWELVIPPKAKLEPTLKFFAEYFDRLAERYEMDELYQKREIIFPTIIAMGEDKDRIIYELRKRYVACGWRSL